jgi:hypothetical protein
MQHQRRSMTMVMSIGNNNDREDRARDSMTGFSKSSVYIETAAHHTLPQISYGFNSQASLTTTRSRTATTSDDLAFSHELSIVLPASDPRHSTTRSRRPATVRYLRFTEDHTLIKDDTLPPSVHSVHPIDDLPLSSAKGTSQRLRKDAIELQLNAGSSPVVGGRLPCSVDKGGSPLERLCADSLRISRRPGPRISCDRLGRSSLRRLGACGRPLLNAYPLAFRSSSRRSVSDHPLSGSWGGVQCSRLGYKG